MADLFELPIFSFYVPGSSKTLETPGLRHCVSSSTWALLRSKMTMTRGSHHWSSAERSLVEAACVASLNENSTSFCVSRAFFASFQSILKHFFLSRRSPLLKSLLAASCAQPWHPKRLNLGKCLLSQGFRRVASSRLLPLSKLLPNGRKESQVT